MKKILRQVCWIGNILSITNKSLIIIDQQDQAHGCVFIAVPSTDSARGNAGVQILDERESVNPSKQMAVRLTHKKAIDAALTAGTSTTSPPVVTQHHPHQRRRHPAVSGWGGWNQSQSSSERAPGQCRSITLISSHCWTMQSVHWKWQHPGIPEKKYYPRQWIVVVSDCKKVKPEYNGVDPHPATIRKYVNANIAGMSPLKPEVKGDIAACVFKSLSVALKTSVRIEQINLWPGEPPYKKLAVRINQVLKHNYKQKMLQHIISAMAKNLDASTIHITKDQWFKCRLVMKFSSAAPSLIIGNLTWSNSALQLGGLTALLPSRMISCCSSYLTLMRGPFVGWLWKKEGRMS